jgi:acetylornithine deacetylase/succinyl-diaminopimelate desuccinylase-like protein
VDEALSVDMAYLMRVLRTLVGINSVLPHEQAVAAFVAEELRALGLEPEWHEVAPGRPNVYATAALGPGERFLVFSGHSDTVDVAPGWETDPFELVERDGTLRGLGVVNMKGGVACQLAALKCLLAAPALHGRLGRLGFAMTVDQEGLSTGARALLATDYGRCDAMLHAEHFFGSSPADYLPSAGTGKVLYRLVVTGKAAHGFRPHLGVNAVDDAARIVAALERLPLPEHPQFGRGTVCTLKIDGGYREYQMVVPERCEVIVNRLLVPGETRESVVAEMRALVDSLALRSEVSIELPPPAFEAYALDPATPIVPAFREAYRTVSGEEPSFAPHKGITDANVFAAEGGIPTVVFGPKGGLHHSAEEYLELASLEPVARIHAETARRFLGV